MAVTFPNELIERAERLLATCRARGLRLATAESCTAGLIAACLTEVAGSSAVVDRGFVTYSNEAKRDLLGVPDDMLMRVGAVSEEVARAMAQGALVRSDAQLAVAVTGIAGPGVYSSNMRIPIDDNSCYMYRFRWSYEPFTEKQRQTDLYGGFTYPEQIPGSFMAVENKDNDYLVDRILQKNYSYTGIKSFPIQDLALVEDQWGPRADRSLEHLVTSDEPLMRVRRRLLKAARELQEGQEPPGPHNPESFSIHTARVSLPGDVPAVEAIEQIKELTHGPTASPRIHAA